MVQTGKALRDDIVLMKINLGELKEQLIAIIECPVVAH